MKFQFNEYGVCTNPNTPINYTDGMNHYTITTCEVSPGAWIYGISCHCSDRGFGFGGFQGTPTKYDTEDKAIHHALREIREYLKHSIKTDPHGSFAKPARKMVADIKKRLPNYMYVQPSLF